MDLYWRSLGSCLKTTNHQADFGTQKLVLVRLELRCAICKYVAMIRCCTRLFHLRVDNHVLYLVHLTVPPRCVVVVSDPKFCEDLDVIRSSIRFKCHLLFRNNVGYRGNSSRRAFALEALTDSDEHEQNPRGIAIRTKTIHVSGDVACNVRDQPAF